MESGGAWRASDRTGIPYRARRSEISAADEVTEGHGDVRSSDSTYAPFALAFASRRRGAKSKNVRGHR